MYGSIVRFVWKFLNVNFWGTRLFCRNLKFFGVIEVSVFVLRFWKVFDGMTG